MALNQGDILAGKYRIERLLGEGGMGAVYVATNQVLQKRVALKVMNERFASMPAAVERFLREAVAASRVSHPGIVQVFDAGQHEMRPWIAMELLEGESLGARLERGPMPLSDVLKMAEGTLSALAEVHDEGIIHRDLKPDNIFLARTRGGDWVPKVLDFGIAKDTSDGHLNKLTATGAVVGTAHYLSPEQAKGLPDIDVRADIYAMGVVLFEALSGQMPYEAETITQLIAMMFTEKPRSLAALAPQVPEPIAQVVATCLEQERDKRFQTARALLGALRAAAEASDGAGIAFDATAPSMPAAAPSVPPTSGARAAPVPTPPPGHAVTTLLTPSEDSAIVEASTPVAHAAEQSERPPRRGLWLIALALFFVLGAAGTGTAAWVFLLRESEPVPVARAGGTQQTASTVAPEVEGARESATDGAEEADEPLPPGLDPNEEEREPEASEPGQYAAAPAPEPETPETEDTAAAPEPASPASPPTRQAARSPRPTRATATAEHSSEDSSPTSEPESTSFEPRARRGRMRERAFDPPQPSPRAGRRSSSSGPGLSNALVMGAVQAELPTIQQRCYQRRLARFPGLQGVITVAWTIGPDGRVQDPRVVHNGTGDEWLARCTRNVVSRMRFPQATNGQRTPARYPFQFRTE